MTEKNKRDAVLIPKPLPTKVKWKVFFYLSILILLLGFGSPYGSLIDVPISFFLKNKLHLESHETANFRFIAAIPIYLSFIFGFARDRWNPFGMRDRGFMILFGGISAAIYVLFAFTPMTYLTLVYAVLLLTISFLFVSAAQQGLTTLIGQQHVMSGQISTLWNIILSLPILVGFLMGGSLSEYLEGKNADEAASILFLVGAGIMSAVAIYGIWKPKSVFENVQDELYTGVNPIHEIKRLLLHWPIYPAMLIFLLWNFAPGMGIPLQYYLQNTFHADDSQWGQFNAIFATSFIPTFILYGFLCKKYPLNKLLFRGTLVAIPQVVPLLFIDSTHAALMMAIPMGLMGGVAAAAYMDLIIRSSPQGLQGTVMMMSWGLFYLSQRIGDVLGTNLYDNLGGFPSCVLATTITYMFILPVILLVPKQLIATADGETLLEPPIEGK